MWSIAPTIIEPTKLVNFINDEIKAGHVRVESKHVHLHHIRDNLVVLFESETTEIDSWVIENVMTTAVETLLAGSPVRLVPSADNTSPHVDANAFELVIPDCKVYTEDWDGIYMHCKVPLDSKSKLPYLAAFACLGEPTFVQEVVTEEINESAVIQEGQRIFNLHAWLNVVYPTDYTKTTFPTPFVWPDYLDRKFLTISHLSKENYESMERSLSIVRSIGGDENRWSYVLHHHSGNTTVTFRNGKYVDFNRRTRMFQKVVKW